MSTGLYERQAEYSVLFIKRERGLYEFDPFHIKTENDIPKESVPGMIAARSSQFRQKDRVYIDGEFSEVKTGPLGLEYHINH